MKNDQGIVRFFSDYGDCYEVVDLDTGKLGRMTFLNMRMLDGIMTMDYSTALARQISDVVYKEDQPKAAEMLGLMNLRHLFDIGSTKECYILRAFDHNRSIVDIEVQVRLYFCSKQRIALITTKNLTLIEARSGQLANEIIHRKNEDLSQGVNKEELLYQLAKDIRNPIHNIIGMCKMTSITEHTGVFSDCVGEVQQESFRILNMVEDVADMSRIAEKQLHLHPNLINMAQMTQDVAGELSLKLKEKDLKLRVYVDNIRFERIIADTQRVHQIYKNVVLNAIKDSYPGTIIKVIIRQLDYYNKKNIIMQVTCENEGYGMKPALVEGLENPFYKTDKKEGWGVAGEGYGLPLAKELTLLMDGHFLVETKENVGTRITVTCEREYRGISAYEVEDKLKHIKLLLLNNDALLAKDAVEILRRMEIYAETMDIKELLDLSMQERLDSLAVYDVIMVPRDIINLDHVAYMRQQLKENAPKLILTAYEWDALEQIEGMDAYLKKPFYASSLRIALKQALGLISKEDEEEKPLWMLHTNILVVEDNEQNQEVLVQLLKSVGCNIRVAENGLVALEILKQKPENYFHMVIMDIVMPLMDGYEATVKIRELPLEYTKHVPIIALSSSSSWEDKERCKASGMNEHLEKPINVKKLQMILRKFLADKCLQ